MLDKYISKFLTRKGKFAYYIGQFIFAGIWLYYLFGIANYTIAEYGTDNRYNTEIVLFSGILAIALVWGFICYKIWPREKIAEEISQ